ncbi:DUF1934 domain-containing protein [Clostridium thermarum]|uniref:DUF1934 domain-containing protein n=1 Tax=Clostridium thermarum TaxID=1716543 RepID=UPI00111F2718|nr:DUF1934 domain-containing protein [Clostridium thermarum]
MDKRALISISSSQGGKKDEVIEVKTPGKYYKQSDYYLAQYNETEVSGMEGTTTSLQIQPNKVLLIREGTTTAKMEFAKDSKYTTLYNTPYGALELVISTKELKVNVDDKGGEIFIKYDMSIAGQIPQKTELNISIKA